MISRTSVQVMGIPDILYIIISMHIRHTSKMYVLQYFNLLKKILRVDNKKYVIQIY